MIWPWQELSPYRLRLTHKPRSKPKIANFKPVGDPAGARGTVSGSGLGIVVLKRLDEALGDGDFIHAVIRGTGINNDGKMKYSYTAPSIEGQAEVIMSALEMAEVDPETITYLEAHGTGTRLGDPIEIEALTKVFRKSTKKKQFCAIGSVKTNIGHLVNAGGVAGLIKTVEAIKHKQIPASLNYNEPNPDIDFANSPFFVNTKLRNWDTPGFPRRAGISSFGIGGTNVHIVVEEAPGAAESGPSREWNIFTLSAKSEKALEIQKSELMNYLQTHPGVCPADIAFTLHVGRKSFPYRYYFLCRTLDEAIKQLNTPVSPAPGYSDFTKRNVIYFIPGESSLSYSRLLSLYEYEEEFRRIIDICLYILDMDSNSFLESIRINTPKNKLWVLFVLQYALASLFIKWGVTPQIICGIGAGGWAAGVLAGVFSLKEALAGLMAISRGAGIELISNPPDIPLFSLYTGEALSKEQISSKQYWLDLLRMESDDNAEIRMPEDPVNSILFVLNTKGILSRSIGYENKNIIPCRLKKSILESLGELWMAGIDINWYQVYAGENRRRIPLPTYPFQKHISFSKTALLD